jgi:small neutral amino acid transporter SnatA (MarC family)
MAREFSLFIETFTTLLAIGRGIDAITRIVGFFVSAMGVGLIFDGVIGALQTYGVTTLH